MSQSPLDRGKSSGSKKFNITPAAEPEQPAEEPQTDERPGLTVAEPLVETATSAGQDDDATVEPPVLDEQQPETPVEPKPKPRKKKAAKKPTSEAGESRGAPPAAPHGAKMRIPGIVFTQDPAEKRVKDWGMLPPSLMTTIEMARMQWTVNNPEWMSEHGAAAHASGFKEALMRLGLKHINDPEFGDLIPPDRRRGKVRRDLDALDDD